MGGRDARYGTASAGIQAILSTAGQPSSVQISALQNSGWLPQSGAPVHFDDGLFAADLARLPESARGALETARGRYEREGVPASERRHCDAEHPSGTRLRGCLKVYIPDFTGPWGRRV